MKTTTVAIGLALTLCASARGQGTTVTVGPPSSGANFQSITAALLATPPSDASIVRPVTIEVQSLLAPSGKFVVLSENTGETFPLQVPLDTNIVGTGGVPVFIGTTNSATDLIRIAKDPAGAAKGVVSLSNLHFFGGQTAVLIEAMNAGEEFILNFSALEFAKNETAVMASAVAGGKIVSSAITRCELTDYDGVNLQGLQTLVTSPQEFGLRFHANGAGVDDTAVDAIVSDLQMADNGNDFDAVTGLGRVIEVIAVGHAGPSEFYVGTDPRFLASAPVPRVALEVNGGNLEAHRKTGGWRTGIYCYADGAPFDPGGSSANYNCSFDVEVYGTTIHEFLDNGVLVEVDDRGRGDLTITGQAEVYSTNAGDHPGATDWFGAGIVGLQENGFLAVRLFGESESWGNHGDGVYLRSRLSEAAEFKMNLKLPDGLCSQMARVAIHDNYGDGVHAAAGATAGPNQYGVVGGGRTLDSGYYYHHPAPLGAMDYRGQGFIDRVAIHNNGARGTHFEVDGKGIASLRTVNSIFWNNLGAAWFVDSSEGDGSQMVCCPVVYSTFAGNGEQLDFSTLELIPPAGGLAENYSAPTTSLTSTLFLHTKFLHSLFQRQDPGDPDFGTGFVLQANVDEDLGPTGTFSSSMMYATGCRDGVDHLLIEQGNPGQPHRWTTTAAVYSVPIPTWTDEDPSQFFLSASGNQDNDEVDSWDGGIPNGILELVVDFLGDPRDPIQNLGVGTPHPDWRGAKTN